MRANKNENLANDNLRVNNKFYLCRVLHCAVHFVCYTFQQSQFFGSGASNNWTR